MVFKNLWAQVKFTFNAMKGLIGTLIKSWVGQFKALAKVISSALKLDLDGVTEGGKDYIKAIKDGVVGGKDILVREVKALAKEMADNMNTAIANTLSTEKLEFVTAEDIQGGVDGMMSWATKGIEKIKAMFASSDSELNFDDLFKDIPGYEPPGGKKKKTPGGGGEDPEGQVDWTPKLQKNKSALRTHLEGTSQMWKDYFAKQDEGWMNWGAKTQAITLQVTDFMANTMGALNAMIRMDNEYQSELSDLESLGLNEEAFTTAKEDLDEKYAAKKKELDKKEAKRAKKVAIFNAIISTAAGIAKALPNLFLAAAAAVLGAAQVTAIAAQPIPLATGGMAFGPTNAIVGDNPNAKNDPEVIAPLSKLKSFLGDSIEQTVRVVGTISGNTIVLSSDKAQIGLNRYV